MIVFAQSKHLHSYYIAKPEIHLVKAYAQELVVRQNYSDSKFVCACLINLMKFPSALKQTLNVSLGLSGVSSAH